MKYSNCDPRPLVKSEVSKNLNLLAKKYSHLWTTENVDDLCQVNENFLSSE